MSFVNVTPGADAAGAWAPGVIDEASSARARELRKPMGDRKRSVDITTSQNRLPRRARAEQV
jgi:hypothetical protein